MEYIKNMMPLNLQLLRKKGKRGKKIQAMKGIPIMRSQVNLKMVKPK